MAPTVPFPPREVIGDTYNDASNKLQDHCRYYNSKHSGTFTGGAAAHRMLPSTTPPTFNPPREHPQSTLQ